MVQTPMCSCFRSKVIQVFFLRPTQLGHTVTPFILELATKEAFHYHSYFCTICTVNINSYDNLIAVL